MKTNYAATAAARRGFLIGWVGLMLATGPAALAQGSAPSKTGTAAPQAPAKPAMLPPAPAAVPGVTPPPGYVIGTEDVLTVVVWREPDMSAETVVRPDGVITLPLINEVRAAGLTPEQLRQQLTVAAAKFVAEPSVSVSVKAINSRKAYIVGQVSKPGTYPLVAPMTVVQLITVAGGLLEYADAENIVILRTENGKDTSYLFNYRDIEKRRRLTQNIQLKPGDQVIVP